MAVVKVVFCVPDISAVQFYETTGEQESSCAWGIALDIKKVGVRRIFFNQVDILIIFDHDFVVAMRIYICVY